MEKIRYASTFFEMILWIVKVHEFWEGHKNMTLLNFFLKLKFRFSEEATKIWPNRPQGFDVT